LYSFVEEYIDHAEIRDLRRHCSARAERGDRPEIVRFGSGLYRFDRISVFIAQRDGFGMLEGIREGGEGARADEFGVMETTDREREERSVSP
jgi:hypothetical protein